ncbi:hypothetical protein OnM2_057035 [Erysiphe neolycopersici]|uniref:Yeast cell wall synthesis Kre9/Knh1-like N-terminal domain-containing protein n=1 Tax=Erysiphe neolycopersici TaxID=212602 RepID=A0A420HQY2_9PEZI|nr:hypothetical protein OnM2_057035 [Erysiphe neolycopersici]
MHYSKTLGAFLAWLAVVRAQTPGFNPFITPATGQDIRAGQDFEITWQPANAPDGATISIKLLQGQSINTMQDGPNVASNIPANAGHFTWAVPRSIQDNEFYSLKMTLDGNENTFQNSAFFDIDNLDNDDDNRPPTPAPNVNPEPQPQAAAPQAAAPEAPQAAAPEAPQSQGFNPYNPGRFRPDRDYDDRFDNDYDDRFDDDDWFDNDDRDFRRPRFPRPGHIPYYPFDQQAASENGVPKAAESPDDSNGNVSPVVPPTKQGTKVATNSVNAADYKLKNGTSTVENKAQASSGALSNNVTTAAASSTGYPPKSKSTDPTSSSNKPSSPPKPLTDSGATSLSINSLFIILGGITIIFAL